jgi:DNA-binding NtrC family response regulator
MHRKSQPAALVITHRANHPAPPEPSATAVTHSLTGIPDAVGRNRGSARLLPATTVAVELLGSSLAVQRAQELVRRAAASPGGVLLVAEPGTEVESVARELHLRGRSGSTPFVAVDCGLVTAAELDRVLFGTSPTVTARDIEYVTAEGRVAAARGGTLYLHGTTDLPTAVQGRLARIARDGEIRLDGELVPAHIRFIASSTSGIDEDVRDMRFRLDLYRRLAATRIDLPPLRDRSDDVAVMAERLLVEACGARGVAAKSFTHAALALLSSLSWPGNLAELRGVVERVVVDAVEPVIQVERVVPALELSRRPARSLPIGNLREARLRFEREYIAAVLQHHGWRMAEAARTLGIQRPNLYRKARQLGIPVARVPE